MVCCKDQNEVKNINNKSPFGIEIKTSTCESCVNKDICSHKTDEAGTTFDFTSPSNVEEILKEYYGKLN